MLPGAQNVGKGIPWARRLECCPRPLTAVVAAAAGSLLVGFSYARVGQEASVRLLWLKLQSVEQRDGNCHSHVTIGVQRRTHMVN